jgi:glycosyltransferase involved in cell wall biosynthesis
MIEEQSIQPLPVTVVIPVRNEEKNLPGCLKAVGKDFAQVVIVDSGSTDRTRLIAAEAGAVVLDFVWDGKFPKKRNWALRNYTFATPWVLFLDADEQVTPEFVQELRATLPDTPHSGFWISLTNWFMGSPLHHGDVFHKLAMFRVGAGEYECFPEDSWSHLDMEVHEHPVLSGTIGEIRARLEHQDYRGMKHYIAKHNEYSTWEANRFRWLQSAGEDEWSKLNTRQRFKYRHLDKWWLGWIYWAVAYFLKKGFLDGRAGWTFNRLKRRYFDEIRLKILEERAERLRM